MALNGLSTNQVIRIFVEPGSLHGETLYLKGQDHKHISLVMRQRPGDNLLLLDGNGVARFGTIEKICSSETEVRLNEALKIESEPPCHLLVLQSMGKGDKVEQVLQHGTEVGATCFQPVMSERSVVTLADDKLPEKMERWRRILKGAAEQSGRGVIPSLLPPKSLADALSHSTADCRLFLHTEANLPCIADVLKDNPESILLAVGPEGGWSNAEIMHAKENGCIAVSLMPRTLRTETAALVAISQLLYQIERRH